MGYSFYVDEENEFVLVRPSGTFTETEFIDANRAFYNHPNRAPRFAHVWDTRPMDKLVLGVRTIDMYRNFLDENRERASDDRVAVIATRTRVETLSRMMSEINKQRTDQDFRFFRSFEPVAEWLDIPLGAFTDISNEQWISPE